MCSGSSVMLKWKALDKSSTFHMHTVIKNIMLTYFISICPQLLMYRICCISICSRTNPVGPSLTVCYLLMEGVSVPILTVTSHNALFNGIMCTQSYPMVLHHWPAAPWLPLSTSPVLLTSSPSALSSGFIFLRVMWPRKPAWILAAALLASGSSRGMSMISSSSWGRLHSSCWEDQKVVASQRSVAYYVIITGRFFSSFLGRRSKLNTLRRGILLCVRHNTSNRCALVAKWLTLIIWFQSGSQEVNNLHCLLLLSPLPLVIYCIIHCWWKHVWVSLLYNEFSLSALFFGHGKSLFFKA